MDKQPSFDRSLLIPIGVGIFAVLGICVILASGRLNQTPAVVQEVPTATAFQYAFIGTEPAFTTVTVAPSEEILGTEPPAATEPPQSEEDYLTQTFLTPSFVPPPTQGPQNTPNVVSTNTQVPLITLQPISNTNTPSRTPTSASTAPFQGGTFDDIADRFVYSGDWDRKTNVAGAYQSTLHVSGTLGNTIKFLFIGDELRVFFQAGPSLGTIRLTLDSTSYVMSEAGTSTQSYEWVLAASNTGTHSVTITHESGGSVNFDAIIVPVVPVTPSNTSTNQ
jgi:hypothetical protein